MPPSIARLGRHTALLAVASYAVVGLVVLGPSIRPGHTLVPADVLTAVQPYNHMSGGVHDHNPLVSDATFQFFPWVHALSADFAHGRFPGWNPDLLGGLRVTPNGFISAYYPPSWLGRWLSPYDLYDVFVFLHLVLGALGVYAFSRVVGARPFSSWLAGLLAFTAVFWIHWSLHLGHLVGLVGAPWALAAAHLVVTRPRPRHVAFLAAVFGLWWLGANPQYAYYGTLAMGAYALTLVVGRRIAGVGTLMRPGIAFVAAVAIGGALAAPVLLSSAAITRIIVRTHEPASSTVDTHLHGADAIRILVNEARGNPPDHVKESANPEELMDAPFAGVTTVLLAGAALATPRRRRLPLMAATIGVLVLGFTGPVHHLLYRLPGYNNFRVSSRWLGLLPVFLLPLAALGLDSLLDGARRARIALGTTAGVSIAAVGAWYIHQRTVAGVPHAYFAHRAILTVVVIAAAVAAGLLAARRHRLALVLLVACGLGEVLFHTPRWYPRIAQRTAYPAVPAVTLAKERGGRIVHVSGADPSPLMALTPDVPMVHRIADVQGWTVLFPKRYDRYLRTVHDYGRFAASENAAPALPPDALASPLLDALDVRTVVSDTALPTPALTLLNASDGVYVYGRPSPGPALLVPAGEAVSESAMWQRIADTAWDPRRTAFVTGVKSSVHGGPGTVEQLAGSSDGDTWDVDAPSGGFLRVSGNQDEGWHATIDGRATTVHLADGTFRGVVVPPGRHRVRFSYTNPSERTGRFAAAFAIAAVVALMAWPAGRRRLSGNRRAASGGERGEPASAARSGPSAPRDG
jgi:hypothetical protein